MKKLSIRNQLEGKVKDIVHGPVVSEIIVRTKAGTLASVITSRSVKDMKLNFEATPISPKLKALLAIAGKVQEGGKYVTSADVARARQQGATDKEIQQSGH